MNSNLGQTKWSNFYNFSENFVFKISYTITAKIMVQIKPPMNPSNVLLGERDINYVFPKSFPKIYANISLVTTKRAGKTNLKWRDSCTI